MHLAKVVSWAALSLVASPGVVEAQSAIRTGNQPEFVMQKNDLQMKQLGAEGIKFPQQATDVASLPSTVTSLSLNRVDAASVAVDENGLRLPIAPTALKTRSAVVQTRHILNYNLRS